MDLFTMFAVLIVASLGVNYIAMQNQPGAPKQKPVAMEDFEFPQAEEGTPQAITFGDCWTEDWMVLGVGNYRTSKVRTKSGK